MQQDWGMELWEILWLCEKLMKETIYFGNKIEEQSDVSFWDFIKKLMKKTIFLQQDWGGTVLRDCDFMNNWWKKQFIFVTRLRDGVLGEFMKSWWLKQNIFAIRLRDRVVSGFENSWKTDERNKIFWQQAWGTLLRDFLNL